MLASEVDGVIWKTGIVPGYATKFVQNERGTAYIHRPILSPEEQKRREQEIVTFLERFGHIVT